MREININIEGYNVNGICVGCLNFNRKMYYRDEVKDCFKVLGDIDVPDGLTIQVCWECLAAVQATQAFQKQILNAYDVLIEYSNQHTFLNSPKDLSAHATTRLSTFTISPCTVGASEYPDTKPDIIEEGMYGSPYLEVNEEVKSEGDLKEFLFDNLGAVEEDEIKLETNEFANESRQSLGKFDFESQDGVVTSEDDLQLSELKKKKVKKGRKKREKKKVKEEPPASEDPSIKKLKKLPSDLVEVFTMTEEEMWQVRANDLSSKEYMKLKYKCEDCIIGFNSRKLYDDHMQGKHQPKGEDSQQCPICKAYFLARDSLSAHRSLHLTAYRCRCGVVCALRRLMALHVRAQHHSAHACVTCGQSFSTKSKLSYHKNVCRREKPQCDCCGKVFANKLTLKYHLKAPQEKQEKSKEKCFIACEGCDKVFHSKKSYRAHAVIHNGLTYPCPICGKLFQWKRNLARHTRNHREREAGERYECRDCGKVFSSRDCYNNHMRLSKRHVSEQEFDHECNYCGKRFATKWCLVDHVDWDHLKRVKYQCGVCLKAFKTAKIMVAHVNNLHEGKRSREPEGEHLCEVCGKSYKTVKRLKGHVWAMHTNRSTTKSFKCKLCPATFTWQTSIYKHTKMMHENKRSKPQRTLPPVKKQEVYQMGPRLSYFPQPPSTVPGLAQNMV